MAQYPIDMGTYIIVSRDPSRYPTKVGGNYEGEVKGYIYDPWNDKYIPNPKDQQEFLENEGAAEKQPKPMSVGETAGITGGVGLGTAAITYGATKYIAPMLEPTSSSGGLLQGAGEGAGQVGAQGGGQVAAQGAGEIGSTSAQGGLLNGGSSGSGVASPTGVSATRVGTDGATTTASEPLSYVGPAVLGALWANQTYEQGGKEIVQGKGKSKDWQNFLINTSPFWWANYIARMFGTSIGTLLNAPKTEVEDKRLKSLAGRLVENQLDPNLILTPFLPVSDNREQQLNKNIEETGLSEDFKGWDNGRFINNKWLKSGEVSDLTGIDLHGYAKITESLLDSGKITADMPPLDVKKAQFDYADRVAAAGAATEGKGTIDIDQDKLNAFNADNPDFTPSSWNEFKYNTSLQSVQEQGVPWQQELARRKAMEPDWTDWNAIEQQLREKDQNNG